MTEDEFARWLPPPDALARLDASWSFQTKIDWIMSRLRSGRLKAAVEDGEVKDQLGTRPISREVIPARLWKKPWNWIGPTFWQTGDLMFFSAPADIFGRPIPGIRGDELTYQGVRFDPACLPAAKPETYNPIGPPTAAEFEEWLRPSDVVNHYYQEEHDDPKAKARAVSMLCDGFLQAAAGQLVINGNDLGLALIPRQMWEAIKRTDVWSTGHFRLAAKDQSISGYVVRVDPRIRTLPRPEPRKPSKTAKPTETKRLSDGRLTEWAKLFFGAKPTATEKEARQSLATMFPDNSVSRARLRAVMPPRQRGRPLKAKEEN